MPVHKTSPLDPNSPLPKTVNFPDIAATSLPDVAQAPEHAFAYGGGIGGGRYKTAPVISDYSFDILEGETQIGTLVATDEDRHDSVRYSFDDGSQTYTAADGMVFNIDSVTALISTTQPLDYELSTNYSFQVLATDLGGNQDSATVTINLRDSNEHAASAPIDVDLSANRTEENAVNGSTVHVTAYANDLDATNNSISYSLVTDIGGETEDTTGPFEINASTGVVSVRDGSLIDYETASSLDIYIKASSADGSSAVSSFTIEVENTNEDPLEQPTVSIGQTIITTEVTRALNETDITNPLTQVFNADNGHIYEFVNTVVSWEDAFALAASSSLSGVDGYLVTITSEAENEFVHQAAASRISVGYDRGAIWLGANDAQTEGAWYWVGGEEDGSQFWQGAGPNGVYGDAGTSVDGFYSNWRAGRYDAPNLVDGDGQVQNADYLLMLLTGAGGEPPGVWEDGANWYQPYGTARPGGNAYAIEYSGDVTETTSETVWRLTAGTSVR